MRARTPAQWKIPYEVSAEPMEGLVTGMGGVAIASRAFRGMKLPGLFDANLASLRRIAAGYTPGQVAETTVVAVMLGADCVEDIDRLRDDTAVEKMLGYKPASGRATAERQAGGMPTVATVDMDATVVESWKRAAQWTYTGIKGYQPEVAVWAEAGAVLATEFRDGNVPAGKDPLGCVKAAFAELPKAVTTFGFRADSACDEGHLLRWLDDEQREGGPHVHIAYAVSARMCQELVDAALAVREADWRTFGKDTDGTLRQTAELDYLPALPTERKDVRPRRYIGLRFLKPQGELFNDGHDRKHFAVVTNRTERGDHVIEWHREKDGTIEHVHDEMKNALAAAALPSQKFGANAAWFALNAVVFNVMAAIRAAAPDPELRVARVKRLRYCLLLAGARLTRFSRKITLRFAATRKWIAMIRRLLAAFPCRVQPTG